MYAARLGLSNAGNATCDTELEYRDEASQTRKNIFCFPKTPEVAAQVDDILVSCWINTTYEGEFTPPPGLLVSPRRQRQHLQIFYEYHHRGSMTLSVGSCSNGWLLTFFIWLCPLHRRVLPPKRERQLIRNRTSVLSVYAPARAAVNMLMSLKCPAQRVARLHSSW